MIPFTWLDASKAVSVTAIFSFLFSPVFNFCKIDKDIEIKEQGLSDMGKASLFSLALIKFIWANFAAIIYPEGNKSLLDFSILWMVQNLFVLSRYGFQPSRLAIESKRFCLI